MICPKCKHRHGRTESYTYSSDDEELCWSCMYQDDIERDMLREIDKQMAQDCEKECKSLFHRNAIVAISSKELIECIACGALVYYFDSFGCQHCKKEIKGQSMGININLPSAKGGNR